MSRYAFFPLVLLLPLCGCSGSLDSTLLLAAARGDNTTVERMLDRHANIDAKDRYGDTPLNLALKNRHDDTAELLVSKGANVNARGALGDTPLHVSVYGNNAAMASLLRQKGANDTLVNTYGLKPADMESLPEIEGKVIEAAELLDNSGNWSDPDMARSLYDGLRARPERYLINAIVLQTIHNSQQRLHVLLLAIKLGIDGSEDKLVNILMLYGDKSMAEDYLNSGSDGLHAGGVRWANSHGYNIHTGPGSHRAGWGRF